MTFVGELFESGGNFIAERTRTGAMFRPSSEKGADLRSFQALVRRFRHGEGDGYRILEEQLAQGQAEQCVDRVVVAPSPRRDRLEARRRQRVAGGGGPPSGNST